MAVTLVVHFNNGNIERFDVTDEGWRILTPALGVPIEELVIGTTPPRVQIPLSSVKYWEVLPREVTAPDPDLDPTHYFTGSVHDDIF